MQKAIKKYITLLLVIFTLAITVITFSINLLNAQSEQYKSFKSSLGQLKSIIDSNEIEEKKAEEMFINDYLNRAHTIAYTLSKSSKENYKNDLFELKSLMEVDDIHVLDNNGIVQYSTNSKSVGLDYNNEKEMKEFLSVIYNDDPNSVYIKEFGHSLYKSENSMCIGVKAQNYEYGMIEICIDSQKLVNFKESINIESTIKNIPTSDDVAFFVVNKKNNNVLGITENNDLELDISSEDNKQKLTDILLKCSEGKRIKIDGKDRYVVTVDNGDTILGAYIDSISIYQEVLLNTLLMIFAVTILSILIICILSFIIKKLFVDEINSILSGINRVLHGDLNGSFNVKSNNELTLIADGLNKWLQTYLIKSDIMTKLTEAIGKNIATFQYLEGVKSLFYSNNIVDLLGLTDDEWNKIKCNKKLFLDHLNNLEKADLNTEENIYFNKNGKYIEVVIYDELSEYYGLIRDVTNNILEKKQLIEDKKIAENEANIDILTGLYNSRGVRQIINSILREKEPKGVLLMFDLDNFKSVNDTQGHPEGDKLLKKFAKSLRSRFRETDIIARLGGDEFVVFLPVNLDEGSIDKKVNDCIKYLRETLKEYYIKYKLSVSIGVAIVRDSEDFNDLYRYADTALYVAKRYGKDGFYINIEGSKCMRNSCINCSKSCRRKEKLGI